MPELLLFGMGFIFVVMTFLGILFTAFQDAVDRRARGRKIENPIDESLLNQFGDEGQRKGTA